MNWQIFETNALNYLKKEYTDCTFNLLGGSNSNCSDIQVIKNNNIFYLEAKMPNSQSGQFVLLKNDDHFVYSPENKSSINPYSRIILNFINTNFDNFKNVGSSPIQIKMKEKIFYDWIIDSYHQKGAKGFISYFKNTFFIFPINNLDKYFHVSASFRRKKSGSSKLGKKYIEEIKNSPYFKNDEVKIINNDVYIISNNTSINRSKFKLNNFFIQLTEETKGVFLVRKLSNTNNANVIFSISLKNELSSDILKFKIYDL